MPVIMSVADHIRFIVTLYRKRSGTARSLTRPSQSSAAEVVMFGVMKPDDFLLTVFLTRKAIGQGGPPAREA